MEYVTEPAREIPVWKHVDVVVAGGGPAGLIAAVAAARHGASTVLVERHGFLGGMATAGLVCGFGGVFHDVPPYRQVVKGIPGELIQKMVAAGGCEGNNGRLVWFEPEAMKLAADDLVEESGVTLLLHSYVVAPIVENGAIAGLVVENKDGRQAILANVVIDATGDGDVAARSGAPYEKGDVLQPMTMSFFVRGVRRPIVELEGWPAERAERRSESHELWRRWHRGARMPLHLNLELDTPAVQHKFVGDVGEQGGIIAGPGYTQPREALVAAMREAARRGEIPSFFGPGIVSLDEDEACILTGHVWGDATNAAELSRAEVQGRRDARRFLEFWRDNFQAFRDSEISQTATQIGIRETRRILGEYVLTEEDVLSARLFDDAIALGCWPVDVHEPPKTGAARDPDAPPEGLQKWQAVKVPYGIPYRCLVPRDVDGLLVAGRCISVTRGALGSTRVMGTCMALGQAAGTAAALAVSGHRKPRELDGAALRHVLEKDGAAVR